ncbi:MAG: sterol desaturase family protein, partial [Myxococcales bacterium]|nr:sterol desaturase family protein [Myxococcales bacterium]
MDASGMQLWALMVTVAALGGLVVYFGFGGWLYLRYYVRRRDRADEWKIQPKRWVPDKLHRWGVRVAATNMALGGLITGTFAYLVHTRGISALYLEVDDYGWAYTVLSTVLMFLALEAAAYYTHRFLHGRWMFRHVHRWHHRVVAPTPFVTVTMHPVEFLMLQATAFLPVFLLPVHVVSFGALLVYVLVFNLMDHSGIRIAHWLPWHSSSSFHDDHHVYFHCNYGQILGVFDRVHGTHRRHGRRYGEDVFGGKGAPA